MRRRGLATVDRTRPVLSLIVASLAALLGATVFAPPVAACGGFFCTTVPVDQAAERVIFKMDEGTVLGISKGAGMLGSFFDIEPVHMVYNAAFQLLLGAVYLGVRRNPVPLQARTTRVTRLAAA